MISILTQERLLGAAIGSGLVGFLVFEQRKRIYESITDHPSKSNSVSQLKEPIFEKEFRSQFAVMWNKAVDDTFRPIVTSLSSRQE